MAKLQSGSSRISSRLTRNDAQIGGSLEIGYIRDTGTTDAYLKLPSLTTTERNALTAEAGMLVYDETLGTVMCRNAGGWGATDGTSAGSLDAAYNGGATIAVDGGAVTLTDSQTGTGGGLLITKSGVVAGSSAASVFHINSTGAHSTSGALKMMEISVGSETASGGVYGIEIDMNAHADYAMTATQGSVVISDGDFTVSSCGASTANGFSVTTANTSGDGIIFNIDSLTSGDGVVIDGDATGGAVKYLAIQEGSSNIFTVDDDDVYSAKPIEIDCDDANAFIITEDDDTEILAVDTTSDAGDTTLDVTSPTTSGVGIKLTSSITTGNAVEINADSATSGNGILVSVASGTMTTNGAAISVIDSSNSDREVFAVRDDGTVYMYGTAEGTTVTQAVTGDVVITDGDLTLSGGEVSVTDGVTTSGAGITLTSSMTTAGASAGGAGGLYIAANSATTGTIIAVSAEAITTGEMLYLDAGGATMTTGYFINCNDDDTSYFTVGKGGSTAISVPAGNNTDALTITQADTTNAKDVIVTSNADTGYDLKMTSTDTGAQGVNWYTYHNSASEADNDVVFMHTMYGNNDATTAEVIAYATIKAAAYDVTDSEEDGELQFHTTVQTTSTEMMTLNDAGGGDITMYVPLEIASTTLTVGPTPGTADCELVVTATTGVSVLTTDGSGASFEIDTDTNGAGDIILDSGGDIKLEAAGSDIDADAPINITVAGGSQLELIAAGSIKCVDSVANTTGATTRTVSGGSANTYEIVATGITLDSAGDIALEAAGNDINADAPINITYASGGQLELIAAGSIKCVDSVANTTGATTRTVSGGSANSYEIVADSMTLDSAGALALESTGVTSDARIKVTQATADTPAIEIDINADTGDDETTDGALFLENTGNDGLGLVVYSNHAGSAGSELVHFFATNTSFDKSVFLVTNDGTQDAVVFTNNGASNALTITQAADSGPTASSDGALYINNTANNGIGLNVYSNEDGAADGELVSINVANNAFDEEGLLVSNAGVGEGIKINNSYASNADPALSIVHAGTGNSILVDANGDTGETRASGGAVVIENTGNDGCAFNVYSNKAGTTGSIVMLTAENSSIDTYLLDILYKGTADAVYIENDGASNAVEINQDGDVGDAVATDGALHIENTGNDGIGLGIYSNHAGSAGSELVAISAANAAYDQELLTVTSASTASTADMVVLTNAATCDALKIDQNGDVGDAVATDGALHIENTGNDGIGLGIYTNHAGSAGSELVALKSNNAAFDQEVLTITAAGDGTVSPVVITSTATHGADKAALEIVGNAVGNADSAVLRVEQTNAAGVSGCLQLKQDDSDKWFINFEGSSGADQTTSVSTMNGDGAVEGPKAYSSSNGWAYAGVVRCKINGTDGWIPFYTVDTT